MMESVLDYCKGLPVRQFAAGDTLLRKGEVDNRLYVLIDGELEVSDDDVQINTQTERGSIFGEMSTLLGVPHTATVKAFRPSRVHVVDDASTFLVSHPDIAFFVARLLARRLKDATDYLVDVKRQFEGQPGHIGMVDAVLSSLLNRQDESCLPGSRRDPDGVT
jgi:CRP-like cAMP-binding protein